MGGWQQMRQLSFGTVDLALHVEYARRADASPEGAMEFARARFLEFSADPTFADFHILTSFTHLFSGGYAAGYYSYLWSEVLVADHLLAQRRRRERAVVERGQLDVRGHHRVGAGGDAGLERRQLDGVDPLARTRDDRQAEV